MEVLLALAVAWMLAVGLLKAYRRWQVCHQEKLAFVRGREDG